MAELLGTFHCTLLVATTEWLDAHEVKGLADEVAEVTEQELARASLLKTPQQVLAVFRQPEEQVDTTLPARTLCLALDGVQDPGNLGTIIRIADWFGIEHIFCSPDTTDAFNPKTVQASMGALARVHLHYLLLEELIKNIDGQPIYGTLLDGENLYEVETTDHGLIVMGNEGNGISSEIKSLVNRRVLIPNYPEGRQTSESLNVAIATAIVCSEFRRRIR